MLVSKERKKELQLFIKKVGLKFKNIDLLNKAFSHTSYIYENNEERNESYERLEFLGDAVLKLSVSDILYMKYKEKNEGQLSEQRSAVVSDKTIAGFAKKLGFNELILTGKCEKGTEKESILACAFEAFLGAIYLEYKDKGYIKSKEFLIKNFYDDILHVDYSNPKAMLQEYTQKYNHNLPEYTILEELGAAHNKTFVMGVYYENKLIGKGTAKTKKEAEFIAAGEALFFLKSKDKENENE